MKISGLIIAIVVISMIVGITGVSMVQLAAKYNPADAGNTTEYVEKYNQLETMSNQAEALENQTMSSGVDSSLTDILGGMFQQGYIAMKMTFNGVNLMQDMSNDALEDANLGYATPYLIAGIPLILLLGAIITLISVIVKYGDW